MRVNASNKLTVPSVSTRQQRTTSDVAACITLLHVHCNNLRYLAPANTGHNWSTTEVKTPTVL